MGISAMSKNRNATKAARRRSALRHALLSGATGIAVFASALLVVSRPAAVHADRISIGYIARDPFGMPGAAPAQAAAGANLRTDPEVERLLERAAEFAVQKRYDLATVLWQKILDESQDTLLTRDNRKYTSIAAEVERTLAELPREALAVYRLTADGQAKELLAAGEQGDLEAAQADVVRRFFFSSHGDDAAYSLGCLALDRHDFVGAHRLFHKILAEHPDSSVPRGEVLLRQAVASSRLGDTAVAKTLLANVAGAPGSRPSARLVAAVESDIERQRTVRQALVEASGDWHAELGRPDRGGRMKAPPLDSLRSLLTDTWWYDTRLAPGDIAGASSAAAPFVGPFTGKARLRRVPTVLIDNSREGMLRRWKDNRWLPATRMLVDGGRIYYKTDYDLVCRDARTGKAVWESAWSNVPELDAYTQWLASSGAAMAGGSGGPMAPTDVWSFGDVVRQGMSIADGVVYSIEGQRLEQDARRERAAPASALSYQYGQVPRRQRQNWLAAYDAATGLSLWRRSAKDEIPAPGQDAAGEKKATESPAVPGARTGILAAGFVAAPVPCGGRLLVPVTDNGSLYLAALSPRDGHTVWRTFLCDEPNGGGRGWSPVAVAVDGNEVYVGSGAGVVFALDGLSGAIRWAIRYERSGRPNVVFQQHFGIAGVMDPTGWDEDAVIPHGKSLMVMASDNESLFALDRRTGDLLWDSPRAPSEHASRYCLGVAGGGLYVAGDNVVRRYEISGGKLAWEQTIDDSYGRGALTDAAVFVPIKDSVAVLDPASGKLLRQVGVVMPEGEPVGNLFSTGEILVSAGPDRVRGLADLVHLAESLDKRIAAGDLRAWFERARLRRYQQNLAGAVEELRRGYEAVSRDESPQVAHELLCDTLVSLRLGSADPVGVLKLLAADGRAVPSARDGRRREILSNIIFHLHRDPAADALPAIFDILSLCESYDLVRHAERAAAASAKQGDVPFLAQALERPDAAGRIVAAAALVRVRGAEAIPAIEALMNDDREPVRVAALRALANAGDRRALPGLVALLASDDLAVRSAAAAVLRQIAGSAHGYAAYAEPNERKASIETWQKWLAEKGNAVNWKHPLREAPPIQGRTLVTFQGEDRVYMLDEAARPVASATLVSAWGCRSLPNGNWLVSSHKGRNLVEFDAEGQHVWESVHLPGGPMGFHRADDGEMLVALSDHQHIVQVLPDGSLGKSWKVEGRPADVRRLENGRILVALQTGNRVVEIDESGTIVWQREGLPGPIYCERLENGNTIVACVDGGKVVEFDHGGKDVASWEGLSSPMSAQRLPGGGTLIADRQGVREFAPGNSVVSVVVPAGRGPTSAFQY
jgi:outer membrane protein assembly factor BamB